MMSVFLHSIDGCTRAAYLATLLMIVFIYDIKHVCFTQIEKSSCGQEEDGGKIYWSDVPNLGGHGTSLGKDKFRRGILDRSPPRRSLRRHDGAIAVCMRGVTDQPCGSTSATLVINASTFAGF